MKKKKQNPTDMSAIFFFFFDYCIIDTSSIIDIHKYFVKNIN